MCEEEEGAKQAAVAGANKMSPEAGMTPTSKEGAPYSCASEEGTSQATGGRHDHCTDQGRHNRDLIQLSEATADIHRKGKHDPV